MDGLAIRSKPLHKTVSQFLYLKFIYSFDKHLSSVGYVLGTVLGVEDIKMKHIVHWSDRVIKLIIIMS